MVRLYIVFLRKSNVVTLCMRIDEWITWPWWVVMLPAFIVDAFLLYMCIGTFPILFAKMKENKTLDEQERLPITYPLLMNINVIIFVVAQVCFLLHLRSQISLHAVFEFLRRAKQAPRLLQRVLERDCRTHRLSGGCEARRNHHLGLGTHLPVRVDLLRTADCGGAVHAMRPPGDENGGGDDRERLTSRKAGCFRWLWAARRALSSWKSSWRCAC